MKMETEAQWDEMNHIKEDPKMFVLISRLVHLPVFPKSFNQRTHYDLVFWKHFAFQKVHFN